MNEEQTAELVAPSALEAISRAEVDMSITTARRYPRQLPAVKTRMMNFATLDVETAENCFYTLPRGGKNIQGPSVRLAEIALSCYGNIKAGSRIIETVTTGEAPHVTVQAVCMDMENNVTITIEKRRRIVGKKSKGGVIDEDDINLASNAGSAIAFRDAIFKVIPLALIKPVFEAAKKVAIGDAKTLVDRRARCLETFGKMGISKEKVLAKLEKTNIEEIGLGELETLIGLHNAIKDGEVNIDEAFTAAGPKPDFSSTPAKETPEAPKPRGRPPGSVNKPSVEQPKANPEPSKTNYLKGVRGLLVLSGIEESDYVAYLHGNGMDDSLTTLEEIAMVAGANLATDYANWPEVEKAIKGDK